jgi:uroporphyrinogen-III synthase
MRVIVTRPAAQAAEWVARLQARGVDATALPLMAIAPAADAAPINAAWAHLPERELLVFVSPNAVDRFFAHRPAEAAWPAASWAGSPGPGTTHVLRGHGVPPERIIEPAADAPQFDSESLWARLQTHDWSGADVLIVRGEGGGRDWLAAILREHGATVAHLAAYRRAAPAFEAAERELLAAAQRAPAAHLWLFSSSEAIDNLAQALPGVRWTGGWAVATHPRIAERARSLGFSNVLEARPALDAVVACIQSART